MTQPMEIFAFEDKEGLWAEIDGKIFRGDNCFLLDSDIRDGGFGGNHNLRYKGERELES